MGKLKGNSASCSLSMLLPLMIAHRVQRSKLVLGEGKVGAT